MAILDRHIEETPLSSLTPICSAQDLIAAQTAVRKIHLSDAVKDYIIRIADVTRSSEKLRIGVSPRGTLALAHVAQAHAALDGRDFVLPDDVKAVAVPVLSHRVISKSQSSVRLAQSNETIIDYLLSTIPAPIE
jgi:MoxR-like ATPase